MEDRRWYVGLIAGIGYMLAHWWLALTLLPDWSQHPFYTEEVYRDVFHVDTTNIIEKFLVAGAGLLGGIAVAHLVRGNGRAGWLLLLVLLSLVGRELWGVPTEWFGLPIFAYGALTLLRCPTAGRPIVDQLVGGGLVVISIGMGFAAACGEWGAWPVAIVSAALGAMVLSNTGAGLGLILLASLGGGFALAGGLIGHMFADDPDAGLMVALFAYALLLLAQGTALMLVIKIPAYAWYLLVGGPIPGQGDLYRQRVRGAMVDE